ncbi:MAG: M20/M25/M40 family metallo-hydrolase [Lachnospiraceae bacterium]|jgi:tripeptide aminopeptidase|nr:M20/M25/M40 family metallo-hydrolase [Lachnospiraceae bacterium]
MLSRKRMEKTFLDMISVYSPSKGEKEMCDWIVEYLKARNIDYLTDKAGEAYGGNGYNIVGLLKGNTDKMPICFAAHLDQIEPCKDVKPVIEGDIIRTDGTTTLGGDDKGGVAAILEAVEDIIETDTPHGDIYLLFTVSEEISMLGAKNMDYSILPCKDIVVADAAGATGVIAYKAPAMEAIEVTFHGRKAHAGIEPEKGINAIVVASKAIANMEIGRLDEETTSNIGRIEGGSATNIVTDKVTFTAEVRSHDMDKLKKTVANMEEACKKACDEMGATCDFVHELAYPTMSLDLESDLYKQTKEAMIKEGIEPSTVIIGGGSDANILAGQGYRSVIISVGMKDVHTVDESIDMAELFKACKVMRRMMGE